MSCGQALLILRAGVVPLAGLEPAIFPLGRDCSIQLSYRGKCYHYIAFGDWLNGRALASGARGSRFKSGVPDQLMFEGYDLKAILVKTVSNALILGAAVYVLSAFWDVGRQETLFAYWNLRGQKFTVDPITKQLSEQAAKSPFAAFLGVPTPLKVTPVSTDFGIVIEKIDVNAPIIPDVPVANKQAYLSALQKGVAHAAGTPKPGEPGNTYLFAHSSLDFWNYGPYSGVFNLLRKLEIGDRIVVFYQGKRFDYYVTSKEIVSGFDTEPLARDFSTPHLTLQTCDPPGIALNRMIVTAELR